ncbi:hypothetical protein D3C80_737000 [compost metagenome]
MALLVMNNITAGREHVSHSALRNTAQQIEQAEFPTGGVFIQISAPDMPTHLIGLDFTAQQRQPQRRVKLAVQEETLIAIGLRAGDDRHRQTFLVRMAFNAQLGEPP